MRAKFVNQNNETPFATHSAIRNNGRTGHYPLSRLQYESSDDWDWDMPMPCPSCGEDTHGEYEQGVCKKCAAQGFWLDKFGRVHNYRTRVRPVKQYESKK